MEDIKTIQKNSDNKQPSNLEAEQALLGSILVNNDIIDVCRFLHKMLLDMYLLEAPEKDVDGNPYIIRYNRTDDVHYLASEKDGKKTKWTATYSDGEWIQNLKS